MFSVHFSYIDVDVGTYLRYTQHTINQEDKLS